MNTPRRYTLIGMRVCWIPSDNLRGGSGDDRRFARAVVLVYRAWSVQLPLASADLI